VGHVLSPAHWTAWNSPKFNKMKATQEDPEASEEKHLHCCV
jgi:hypothetical protein